MKPFQEGGPPFHTFAIVLLATLVTFPARVPGTPSGLRTTDLVNCTALLGVVVDLLRNRELRRCALPLVIAAALSATWIMNELFNYSMQLGEHRARMVAVRWIMSLPTAYWLAVLMGDARYRGKVALGMIIGAMFAMGSIVYDDMTFDPDTAVMDSDDKPTVWVYDQYRASGIFSHPNAAAAGVLLLVPLVVGAIDEGRLRRYVICLPLALVGIVFAYTMTRGPVLVAGSIIGWHLLGGLKRSKIPTLFLLCALLVAIALIGPHSSPTESKPLVERLMDSRNIQSGAKDRFRTVLVSLELALTHPLGVGSRYEKMLMRETGFSATHNGYLQLALLGGMPIALFITAGLLRRVICLIRERHRIESQMALYIAGALLFENQFFVPTFSILALWLIAYRSDREARAL